MGLDLPEPPWSDSAGRDPHSGGRPGRVAVVGAINVDLMVAAPRLPGPGETVVGPGVERHGGGKGANAAVAAARAGAAVAFFGGVGEDPVAGEAERELREAGVDCEGVERLTEHPTGLALIVVAPDGENQIAVGAGANAALDADRIGARLDERAATLDCLLVSTEIPGPVVLAAVTAAARAGLVCVLNPAPPIPAVLEALAYRPILTPNRGELAILLGMLAERTAADAELRRAVEGKDAGRQARALSRVVGAPVVVTLGADGALLAQDDRIERVAALPVRVRDATGAGDTFNGVLAATLAAAAPLRVAVARATVAASLSVEAIGARSGMPDAKRIAAAQPGSGGSGPSGQSQMLYKYR